MQDHFSFGFRLTNNNVSNQRLQGQKQDFNAKQQDIEEESNENMLFMIGTRQIAEKHLQVIDIEESQASDDSDKTINLKIQQKKQKKNKKHKEKHKKKHKHKQEKYQTERQKFYFDIEKDSEQQLQSKKNHKKEKKIKKHKGKERKRSVQNEDQALFKIMGKQISDNKKPKITLQEKSDQKHLQYKLFPSLLQQKELHQQSKNPLVPLPSFINQHDSSSHLYTSYLQKLQSSSLLPSRTLKQMSNSIISKNEEFNFIYNSDDERFEKQIYLDFFTNGRFPDYLKSELMFDIIRFPTKQLYTYGKHMDKDVPMYKLILNYNKVIGVKTKKQRKYEKIMNEIYRELNQSDYSWNLKSQKRDRGNDERYFHYEGYEKLMGVDNLVENRKKLRMLRLKQGKVQQQQVSEPFPCLFLPFSNKSLQPSYYQQLSTLQSFISSQFRQRNRQLNISVNNNPGNIQLWLKLVDLQDDLLQLGNEGEFVVEKKLTILWKGLRMNQYNQRLGAEYFKLLFGYFQRPDKKDLPLVTEFESTQSLASYLLTFITKYSTNPVYWLLYLNFKLTIQPTLNLSSTFTHTYIKHVFTQIATMINKFIQMEKSAVIIKQYRRVSLLMVERIMRCYCEQGYKELALGIGIGLLEFNLFVPKRVYELYGRQGDLEKKKKEFKDYWEDYKQEKVGDLAWGERSSWEIWDERNQTLKRQPLQATQRKQPSKSYIDPTKPMKHHHLSPSPAQYQQQQSQNHWHPANPLYNKQRIKQSIQSLVLYEDIQKWLLNYRDSENILRLINMVVVNGIELKRVFGLKEEVIGENRDERVVREACVDVLNLCDDSLEAINYRTNAFQTIKSSQFTLISTNLNSQLFESKYWSIELTSHLQYRQIIYLSRLLRVISPKILPALLQQKQYKHIYELHEYRMFLLGVIYVSSLRQEIIVQSDDDIFQEMRQVLGWSAEFIDQKSSQQELQYDSTTLWGMYVQFQWLKKCYSMINNIQSQTSQKFIIDSVRCYQQVIGKNIQSMIAIHDSGEYIIEWLLLVIKSCRYYIMFLSQINSSVIITYNTNSSQYTKTIILKHIMSLLTIIFSPINNNNLNSNNGQVRVVVSNESQGNIMRQLVKQQFQMFNNDYLLRMLAVVDNKIQGLQHHLSNFITNPIKKLQQANIVRHMIILIKQQSTSDTGGRQDYRDNVNVNVKIILKWLQQLVGHDEILLDQNQNNYNNIMNNNEQQQTRCEKINAMATVYKRRLLTLFSKHRQLPPPTSHTSTNPATNLSTLFPNTLNNTIHSYKLWCYISININHHHYDKQILQLMEITLDKNIRLLQSDYQQQKDSLIIYDAKMKQLYKRLLRKMKALSYNNNVQCSPSISASSSSTSYHFPQFLLSLIMSILSYRKQVVPQFKQHLQQLRQVIYPLIVKYPQSKSIHLWYIRLVEQIGKCISKEITTNKQIQKYRKQMQQLVNRMKTNGIRLIQLQPVNII